MKIGILGFGKMGEALAQGLRSERLPEVRKALQSVGYRAESPVWFTTWRLAINRIT